MTDKDTGLDVDDYQRIAATYAIYPKAGRGDITYTTLLVCSEAGELAGKLSKLWRDQGYPDKMSLNDYSDEIKLAIAKELGDLFWAAAMASFEAGFDASEIMRLNIAKLEDRRARGVLKGSGDDR